MEKIYIIYDETRRLFISESGVSSNPGNVALMDGATAREVLARELRNNPGHEIRVMFYDEAEDMWMQW